jgi:hypothetical protein
VAAFATLPIEPQTGLKARLALGMSAVLALGLAAELCKLLLLIRP